jgi:hypothetical protein
MTRRTKEILYLVRHWNYCYLAARSIVDYFGVNAIWNDWESMDLGCAPRPRVRDIVASDGSHRFVPGDWNHV